MQKNKIDVTRFLELAGNFQVIDVRSPSEFCAGHIPGAHNIPLFDDEERKEVGIRYKNEGRIPAILHGLHLAGPKMTLKLEKALEISGNTKLLVHCWRGGMRSEAMAWLFSLGDIETETLEGGYKAYRHHILEYLSVKRKTIILGGLTGSGKTEILRYIKNKGHQVIDLEGLACHKGSVFGALGQPEQPNSEHFANLLYSKMAKKDFNELIWMEDESKNIGTVFMPDGFFSSMQESQVIALMIDAELRLPRLIEEYSKYPKEKIISSINRIHKRIGGDKAREAIKAVEDSDFSKAIRITLDYYDKTYMFGLRLRSPKNIVYVKSDTADIETNAMKIIGASQTFQ